MMAEQVNTNDANNNDGRDTAGGKMVDLSATVMSGPKNSLERVKNNETDCMEQSHARPTGCKHVEKCHKTTTTAGANDAKRNETQRLMSDANDNDNDWHLLDVDGHSIAASSTSSSSNEQDVASSELLADERRQKRRLLPRRGVAETGDGHDSACDSRKLHISSKKSRKDNKLLNAHQEKSQHRNNSLSPSLVLICTALYALVPLASFLAFLTLVWLLVFTRYWYITIIYYTYLLLDSNTCNKGGRRIEAVYKSRFWSYLAAYFPIQLRYSNKFKLDPSENYILNYHPHGISAFGCVTTFATNGLNFCQLFPGITARFMVHETSFLVPIMRETFASRGDCSVNSKSFDYILSKKWKNTGPGQAGNLLALCGGGLAEADLSHAKCLKIVVKARKGFIKKALIHGANLIPCIAFGENSVFTKINLKPGSLLHKLENHFYNLFKFKHPIYYGLSLFGNNKSHGALPYKRHITVIMGDPIQVDREEKPSQEQIDQLHDKYIQSLQSLYAENQDLCTEYDVQMELV